MLEIYSRTARTTDVWYTPRGITKVLGKFDLDPCTSQDRPWTHASRNYTDRGLSRPWTGRVWLNPPYGGACSEWLAKMAKHGDGVALVFIRSETTMFHDYVWGVADSVFFLRGRVKFADTRGVTRNSASAPSVLVAYGRANSIAVQRSGLPGFLVQTNKEYRP